MVSMPILNELREAVAKDGRAHAAICRECGIHPKTFSSFIHGRRGLSIETIENLAAALRFNLRLVKVRAESKTTKAR
jgi:plasmid maintenance system antidote protein VapI